jgi:CHAT domain-containing protein/tetratricopeptide (TPR) repeat protein
MHPQASADGSPALAAVTVLAQRSVLISWEVPMVRLWAYFLILLLIWNVLLQSPAAAQSNSDLAAMSRQARDFVRSGNYTQAVAVAQRAIAQAERQFGPNHLQVAGPLNDLAIAYNALGRHAEAEPLYKRSLAIYEKALGPNDASVATLINNLADVYGVLGRNAEAEQAYKRALAIREKTLGPQHIDVAGSLNGLAELYRAQNRYAEAEPLYKRSLAIAQKGLKPEDPVIGVLLNNLGLLYDNQGRFGDAEPLYRRALALREKNLGPDHPDVAITLNNIANLYFAQGRYADSEPLYKRAITINQKALGPDHASVAMTQLNLAIIYANRGQFAEAEPLYKRSLAALEKGLGPNHFAVGSALNSLGTFYQTQGRYAEAEPLLKRSLEVREQALGPNHRDVAASLFNLASLYHRQGRYADAEPLYARALKILERVLGPDHADVGTLLSNLALLYDNQGRLPEAEPLYRRSLALREKVLGPDHPDVAASLNNLGGVLADQGRFADAEPLYRRSLAVLQKAEGPDHPDVGHLLQQLGELYFRQWQWAKAADYWRQSTGLVVRRVRRGTQASAPTLLAKGRSETERESYRFLGLIKALSRVGEADRAQMQALALESFRSAQWAQASEAAASLAQMSARQSKGEGGLARLVRERQDLTGEWQTIDKALVVAVSQQPNERNPANEQTQRARLKAIDARVAEIDKTMAKGFPEYAALANPEPLSISDIQTLLHSDEILVLLLDTRDWKPTPQETFIWAVTKTEARWVRSDLGSKALAEHVAALRCGLDRASWEEEGAARCSQLLKGAYSVDDASSGKPLPFDLGRAHVLYQGVFGQIQDMIKDKHLLVMPSGALTSIPLQALVTEHFGTDIPTTLDAYARAAWLAKLHAITILPSVGSLGALRQLAKASKATQSFIGFGNPLLLGPGGSDRRAWLRQACSEPSAGSSRVASRSIRAATTRFYRGGLADVDFIRRQYPLPETVDELCAVANSAGAQDGAVYLGQNATEKTIKALSASGALGNARVVHFATHGLLADETAMFTSTRAEPALILTPPIAASDADDGLLTASEIAQLKLDAEWVVLSACNTAAGGGDPGSEALSGLARAFFYAGARALLVSHWAVDSEATVSLITKAFEVLKLDAKAGRAEALRRSMVALIESGDRRAHPANWAPFVVVGEGAATR